MEKTKIIESAVSKLMNMFKSGDFPAQLATTIIRRNEADEIPSDSWSIDGFLCQRRIRATHAVIINGKR